MLRRLGITIDDALAGRGVGTLTLGGWAVAIWLISGRRTSNVLPRPRPSLRARTRVVYGGHDALAAIDAEAPALVLLDLGMPGMDGYQVVRRLADHPQRSRMYVVALTGWGQAEDRQRTREAGFDEHLVKPAELEALEALLARVSTQAAA